MTPDRLYIDDYYYLDPARMRPEPTVVEIGVFTTEKMLNLKARWPKARVILIEPDPCNYAKCARLADAAGFEHHPFCLAEQSGPMPFHHYDHEQRHSGFPRHVNEGLALQETFTVEGRTLHDLLADIGVDVCDYLALNCEGGELFALWAIIHDPDLRARIPQICTSFHCDHCQIYPKAERRAALDAMGCYYAVETGTFKPIPYYLFSRRQS